jgi:hypothetical protein
MIRSISAIVAGYVVFGASSALLFATSGHDPHLMPGAGFLVGSIVYGAGFSMLAGYLSARLAPTRPLAHAAALAALVGVIALASMVVEWHAGSIWSELVVIFFLAPSALLGGYLRTTRRGQFTI